MEAQANTTREQSNNNIYDVGWRPSHGENGVGKKNSFTGSNVNIVTSCIGLILLLHIAKCNFVNKSGSLNTTT